MVPDFSTDRLQALEEVGFVWARRKGQPSWDNRYDELLVYRQQHGNCEVRKSQFPHFASDTSRP